MSNELKGTVSTGGNLTGNLNVARGYDGESAYEIAVKNGFKGTEKEWLLSLKGSSGVYVGSGDMPENCNVQIDPDGESLKIEQVVQMILARIKKVTSVTLYADKWVGTESPFTQVVTIPEATANSKIDLNPTVEQLNIFYNKDITFVVGNNNGTITVYCIGQKPTQDYTMQTTITEVAING